MLTLTEHGRSEPVRLSLSQQGKLRDLFRATIEPAADGLVTVTPGSRVGAAVVDGEHVVVAPKVPLLRIVHMLSVASDPVRWAGDTAEGLRASSLEDTVAVMLARACMTAFSAGVYRSYRTERQQLAYVRGRIRVAEYLRDPRPLPVPVTASVHDEDVPENQVLAAAVKHLRQVQGLSATAQRELSRVWQVVGETTPLSVRTALELGQRIRWSRHNLHYQAAIRFAVLVLEGQSLEVTEGRVRVPGFVLDMPRIVEQYVRVLLRRELGAMDAEMPDSWSHRLWLDEGRHVQLIPDLGMRRDGRWRFVGDVKYKVNASTTGDDDQAGWGRRDDLYQLLAYVTETGLDEGTLIYAGDRTGETVHTVRGTRARLRVVSVDLGAADCDQQVRRAARTGVVARPPSSAP